MLAVKFICVGRMREKFYIDAFSEYTKRLQSLCKFEIIEPAEQRLSENPSDKEVKAALDKEAQDIMKAIPNDAYVVAMCVEGKQLSSEEFAEKLDQISTMNGELSIIIGSSYGLSNEIKNACDYRLSVSKMTLTHQMLRVWLVEIIYRCLSINHGGKYHK